MLSAVSWSQYFLFLLIVTIAYYIFIWLVILKMKVPALVPVNRVEPDQSLGHAGFVIEELRPLFRGKQNKNELVLMLRQELTRYHRMSQPGFREAINQFILQQSSDTCYIHLSEVELREVWKE